MRVRKKRVLVVDDDAEIRLLVTAIVRGAGYMPLQSANTISAMQSAQRNRPEAVLVDLDMPGPDGITLLRLLREDPATRDARLIVLSGFTAVYERQLQGIDHDAVVKKPVDADELTRALRKLLR